MLNISVPVSWPDSTASLRRVFADRVRDGRERMNTSTCGRCGRFTWQHEPVDIDRVAADGAAALAARIDAQITEAWLKVEANL